MNTIVMNTINGAVTEHQLDAHSLTSNYIANDTAIYEIGGDADGTTLIDARVMTGKTDWGSTLKKLLECAYFAIGSNTPRAASGLFIVKTEANKEYSYSFTIRKDGESHATAGRGIRENRMAFGFANIGGVDFRLDAIEIPIGQSDTRRT